MDCVAGVSVVCDLVVTWMWDPWGRWLGSAVRCGGMVMSMFCLSVMLRSFCDRVCCFELSGRLLLGADWLYLWLAGEMGSLR